MPNARVRRLHNAAQQEERVFAGTAAALGGTDGRGSMEPSRVGPVSERAPGSQSYRSPKLWVVLGGLVAAYAVGQVLTVFLEGQDARLPQSVESALRTAPKPIAAAPPDVLSKARLASQAGDLEAAKELLRPYATNTDPDFQHLWGSVQSQLARHGLAVTSAGDRTGRLAYLKIIERYGALTHEEGKLKEALDAQEEAAKPVWDVRARQDRVYDFRKATLSESTRQRLKSEYERLATGPISPDWWISTTILPGVKLGYVTSLTAVRPNSGYGPHTAYLVATFDDRNELVTVGLESK